MKQFLNVLRYSAIGTACVGVFSAITGFFQGSSEQITAIIILLLLLLPGCGVLITVEGEGSGTVTGNGIGLGADINCTITNSIASGECSTFVSNTSENLSLIAAPTVGFTIDRWEGCDQTTNLGGIADDTCIVEFPKPDDLTVRIIFEAGEPSET